MSPDPVEAVVQVPAFDEADLLLDTLDSLIAQTHPRGANVEFEVWVTPHDGETMAAAERATGYTVHEAPSGKLSARNAAHNHAISEGADVIVSWDADAVPLSDRALSGLIETAAEPGVAVANSVPVATTNPSLPSMAVDVFGTIEDAVRPHIHGQAHAMTAEAWEQLGPFDTDLDETDGQAVRREEEFDFYRRAIGVGRVVTSPEARVYNNPRRHYCRIGVGDDDYCDSRGGVKTFHPFDRR